MSKANVIGTFYSQAAAIASYVLEAGKDRAPVKKAEVEVAAAEPEPKASSDAAPAPEGEGEKKLSKNALKKLAKNKGKKKKEKPQWGDGSKKKEKAKPKEVFKYVNKTPKGQKKDVSTDEMLAAYQPSSVESAWQDWWEAEGYYTCDPKDAMGKKPDADKFVMVIPPPNVTGSLHLGHALTAAVEDTLTRWHRMCGHATLYVPGESSLRALFITSNPLYHFLSCILSSSDLSSAKLSKEPITLVSQHNLQQRRCL